MIIKYWVDFHKFGCAPLYGFFSGITKFFKKIAPIALPIIGFAVAGPLGLSAATGAAIGGAAGGLISGGGIKGAIIGGLTGYAGGKLAGGGFFGGAAGAGGGAVNFAKGAGAGGLMGMSGTGAGTTAMLSGLTAPSAGMAAAAQRGFGTAAGKNVSLLGQVQAAPISSSGLAGKYGHLSGAPQTIGQGVKSVATGGAGVSPTQTVKGALKQGFSFDREKIEELVGAGFSAYEGDIRQQQIEATQKNLDQYQDQFADFYSKEAKKQQEALARGELPKTYEAALQRESDRLTRLMIAQGHNPAESGFGAETVVRGLMDLESKFIGEERDYWKSIGAGAEGMQARIQELQSRNAQQQDVGLSTLGELGSKVAGTLADLI